MSFDISSLIGSVAPTLATMLGGPLAGTAVKAIVGAIGLPTGSTIDDVTKVAQSGAVTPENIVALKAADAQHSEMLGQQGIDLAKINAAHVEALATTQAGDLSSARGREIAVKDNTPRVLTYLYTLGLFLVIGAEFYLGIAHIDIDPLTHSSLDTLLGVLMTMVIGSKEYYLGTSSGDAHKTELLAKSTPPDTKNV
jgi:hypothetical protein